MANQLSDNLPTNSFYRYGGIEILNIEQDEKSFLYKIKLATPEHYVVSREFDRSVGILANAPDEIVRNCLMNFSDTLQGSEYSIFAVMDLFIDRCFSNEAFYGTKPEFAVWFSTTFPTYDMIEEILNGFGYRLKWFPSGSSNFDTMHVALYKTYSADSDAKNLRSMASVLKNEGVSALVVDSEDKLLSGIVMSKELNDFTTFKTTYKQNGSFNSLQFLSR